MPMESMSFRGSAHELLVWGLGWCRRKLPRHRGCGCGDECGPRIEQAVRTIPLVLIFFGDIER
jgi:hypothetical protein